ncbi:MAG: DUF2680 domain-containing protein [Firmicutes bacterium]|mgnify:CR=1 FL=1|nr:DUF2680 domain-containing protein [Bacillota bacterium]
MKKSLVIALVVVLIGAISVPVAFALTETQKDELYDLYRQEYELRLQIVEKQKEAGLIADEVAEELKARLTDNWQHCQERMRQGDYAICPCLGYGGRGRGKGRLGGYRTCHFQTNAVNRWESAQSRK